MDKKSSRKKKVKVNQNFIEQIIEEELAEGKNGRVGYILAFRRNRTGTCISGMQLLYA